MSLEPVAPCTDNVILIGMPGAGKSTLGVVLAKIINADFLDADLAIQQRCGTTLQSIIDSEGVAAFLELENDVLKSIETTHPTIIATGGSAIYSDEAMKHLAAIGTIVYLKVSYDELRSRLVDFQDRGVVMKEGVSMSLRDIYDERLPLYERYAEIVVNVDDLSITASARRVAKALDKC